MFLSVREGGHSCGRFSGDPAALCPLCGLPFYICYSWRTAYHTLCTWRHSYAHIHTHSQMHEHTHTWLTLGLRALSEPMCQLWALLPSVEYIYISVCVGENEHFVQYSWVFLQLWAILVMWSFLPLNYLLCLTEFCSVNNIFNINKNGIKCLCSLDKLHC